MKKIISLFLSVFMLLAFVSCGGDDLKTLRENPDIANEIKENLNFDFTTTSNSIRLNKDKGTATSYYDVYISENYESSLFVVSTAIDDTLFKDLTLAKAVETKRFKSLNVYPLMFNLQGKSLYTAEQTQIFNELSNTTYGLLSKTGETLNYDFGFNDQISIPKTWTTNYTANYLLKAYEKGCTTNLALEVVYIPVIYERVADGNLCLRTHMLVPLYVAYTYNRKAIISADNENGYELKDTPITSLEIKTLDYELDDNGNQTGYLATKKDAQ